MKWYSYVDLAGKRLSFPHRLTPEAMEKFGYSESGLADRSVKVGGKKPLEIGQVLTAKDSHHGFAKKGLLKSFAHAVQDLFHIPKERKATPGYMLGRIVGEIEVIGNKNPETLEGSKRPKISHFMFGRMDTRDFKDVRLYSDTRILWSMSSLKKGKFEGIGMHNLLAREARRRKLII